jgi:hypothetical protein
MPTLIEKFSCIACIAMTIAQQRIAETIDQFYDETASRAVCGEKYKAVVTSLDEEARTEMVGCS